MLELVTDYLVKDIVYCVILEDVRRTQGNVNIS
jgi:hypothetical protein